MVSDLRGEKGKLDLRPLQSSPGFVSRPVALKGDWEFHWKKIVKPGAPESAVPGTYIPVPRVWNEYRPEISGFGFATYRLTVLTEKPFKAPAIKMLEAGTAYRLYVNGRLVGGRGTVGRSVESSFPDYRANVMTFPGGRTRLEIVLHVSNFRNRWGGVWNTPILGETQDIIALRENSLLVEHLLCGILLFMGVYHLALFLYRPRDSSPLFFALFCLIFALRTSLVGERFWLDVFPGFDWELAYKLEYLTFFMAMPVWASFVRKIFPREISAWVVHPTWFLSGAASILVLFTPVLVYSRSLTIMRTITIVLGAYVIVALVLTLYRRREGALLFLAGWFFLFLTIVLDLMRAQGLIDIPPLAPTGLAIFTLFQSLMLAGRFSRAFSATEKMSAELEYKVIERTRDLKQARDVAEKSSRAKSEFLSVVSHEIRTPLNAVIGTADLLSEHSVSEEHTGLVKMLQRSGRSLLTLIDEILDISRIEAGKLELESVNFSPAEVAEGSLQLMGLRAREKGLALHLSVADDVPSLLRGDPDRLHQILVNLLGNAVKFTSTGEIRVGVDTRGPLELQFTIADTGPGMPANRDVDLFEPFAQADSSISRKFGGSGLGLAIVRRMVAMMNGEIQYENRPEGGAVFTFTARFMPPGRETHKDEAPFSDTMTDRDIRILIAEDNPDNQVLLRAFLKESKYRVWVVQNGAEALALVETRPFDLILMDIQMPVMDGLNATRRIREWEKQSNQSPTIIIALSANATSLDIEKSREAGCDDHITKPISKRNFLRAVEQAVRE